MDDGSPPKHRVLDVLFGRTAAQAVEGQKRDVGPPEELLDLSGTTSESHKPDLVYVYGSFSGDRKELERHALNGLACLTAEDGSPSAEAAAEFVAAFQAAPPAAAFLDFAGSEGLAARLRAAGVAHVLAWADGAAPGALASMHFAQSFFGALGCPATTVPEAFALACRVARAHLTAAADPSTQQQQRQVQQQAQQQQVQQQQQQQQAQQQAQRGQVEAALPFLLSDTTPALPGTASVPPPAVPEGTDLSQGLAAAFPGYQSIRMLAPTAELRLLLCGLGSMINPQASRWAARILAYWGEALRGWLAAELRSAALLRQEPVERSPAHLPAGCVASRCQVATASGATVSVTLGAPQALLDNAPVVEHALRQTLVADACSLQVKLPPPGVPLPALKQVPSVAAGAPVVEDANRLTTVLSNNDPSRLLAPPPILAPAVPDHLLAPALLPGALPGTEPPPAARLPSQPLLTAAGVTAAVATATPLTSQDLAAAVAAAAAAGPLNATALLAGPGGVVPWVSSRPALSQCSEEQFYSDLIAFLTDRQGSQIDPAAFPEAILNGARLDLYRLYRQNCCREVCRRGGYKVGNGINWKGQVFPRMRNFTAQHRMTGVGNALKRHYQAHPQDVRRDICSICRRGEEGGTDWVCCDMCDCWTHFSCDRRPYLGSFKDYSKARGRIYHCLTCTEIKRQRYAQQAAVAQARGAGCGGSEHGRRASRRAHACRARETEHGFTASRAEVCPLCHLQVMQAAMQAQQAAAASAGTGAAGAPAAPAADEAVPMQQ
eukprot:scaffold13.g408.t1